MEYDLNSLWAQKFWFDLFLVRKYIYYVRTIKYKIKLNKIKKKRLKKVKC